MSWLNNSRLVFAVVLAAFLALASLVLPRVLPSAPDDTFTALAFATGALTLGNLVAMKISGWIGQDVDRHVTWDFFSSMATAFFGLVSIAEIDSEPRDEKAMLWLGFVLAVAVLVTTVVSHPRSRFKQPSIVTAETGMWLSLAGLCMLIIVTGFSLSRSAGHDSIGPWVAASAQLLAS